MSNSWVRPEPAGPVRLQDLRARRSRQLALDDVLAHFGFNGPAETRESMRHRLREEAERLGPPESGSDPTDPAFAAMSALNLLDPANYSHAEGENGTRITYHLPAQEAQLRAGLQEEADRGNVDREMHGRMMRALVAPSPCPSEVLEQGVAWAMRRRAATVAGDDDHQKWIGLTRLIVAALVWRDGTSALRTQHGQWAQAFLAEAAQGEADARGMVQQLPYNPRAIAAVGLLAAYRVDPEAATLERLLHVAVQHDTGMPAVLRAEAKARRSVPPVMLRTLMRLGLISTIYALPNRDPVDWDSVEDYRAHHEAQEHARKEAERARLQAAVAAELRWLSGDGEEPGWPELPDPMSPKVRAGISVGMPGRQRAKPATPREYALDSRAAAHWISHAKDTWYQDAPERLRGLVHHCWAWTAGANGVGCEKDEEPGEHAQEWNDAYFAAATAAAATLGDVGISELVLQRVAQLPQDRFLDATTAVLHELDRLWLNDGLVSGPLVLLVRETLASRIREFWVWKRLTSECSTSAEIHLTGALAALLMGEYEIGKGPRCYISPPGAEGADALLPMLTRLAVEAAPSTFVALAILGVLEVQPQVHRLTFLAEVASAWWRAQGAKTEFWNDYGIGSRVCDWVEKAVLSAPVPREVLDSAELTSIVDTLIQTGTPLARILDEKISARRDGVQG